MTQPKITITNHQGLRVSDLNPGDYFRYPSSIHDAVFMVLEVIETGEMHYRKLNNGMLCTRLSGAPNVRVERLKLVSAEFELERDN